MTRETRRQIGGTTLRTAAILGAAGGVLSTIIGIGVAFMLAHFHPIATRLPLWLPVKCPR